MLTFIAVCKSHPFFQEAYEQVSEINSFLSGHTPSTKIVAPEKKAFIRKITSHGMIVGAVQDGTSEEMVASVSSIIDLFLVNSVYILEQPRYSSDYMIFLGDDADQFRYSLKFDLTPVKRKNT